MLPIHSFSYIIYMYIYKENQCYLLSTMYTIVEC